MSPTKRDLVFEQLTANPALRMQTMQRLFKKRHLTSNGCVEWTGVVREKGYGEMGVQNISLRVHRLSWVFANGRLIPPDHFICHTCDNPPCFNPEHLFLGTVTDNVRDSIAKGGFKGWFNLPSIKGNTHGKQ